MAERARKGSILSALVLLSASCSDNDQHHDGGTELMDIDAQPADLDANIHVDSAWDGTPTDTAVGERVEEVFDGGATRTFYWTDWTSATRGLDGGATGFVELPSGRVEVIYSGQLSGAQLEPATRNFWAISETYVSAAVHQPPTSTDALQIDGAQDLSYELKFSRPVKDPIFAFGSLGSRHHAASYKFEIPFLLLSQGKGFYVGDGYLEKLPDNLLIGHEANGVIGLEGTFSSIRWTSPHVEPWHALTIGVAEDKPAAVP